MIDYSHPQVIARITQKHGAMIWKHSIAILSRMDEKVDEYTDKEGGREKQFETMLDLLTSQIHNSLAKSIENEDNVKKTDLCIRPTGTIDKPDLPKPHEKWHSLLWNACFLSSKNRAKPAILKLSQDRISYNVKASVLQQKQFHDQPILTKERGLSEKVKLTLGLGEGGAAAGAAVAGATIGGLVGALAFGVPTFGVAAKTGLAIGAMCGAGLGVGAAGVATKVHKRLKQKPSPPEKKSENLSKSITAEKNICVQYSEVVTYLPYVVESLRKVARGQVTCRIVVTGVEGENSSQLAAALTGRKKVIERAESYWKPV